MGKQLKISYSSAYLKYQLLKGAWFIHKNSVQSQLKTVYQFLNNELIVDDNQEEPKMTQPYTLQVKAETNFTKGQHIAVIPIMGSLMKKDYCGAPGMQSIVARIKQAEQTESVSAILFHVDSPGGTVDGTQELGQAIKNCSKPTMGFADGLAASAAYWAISSCDMVIAKDTTTEIGSVGVVLSFVDNQKAMEEKGYVFHDIFADQSDEKWKEMIDAQKGDYTTIKEWTLNPLAAEFQEAVMTNRPAVKDKALHGRVYLAKTAKKFNLIDKIGSFDFAVSELNKMVINKNTKVMADNENEVKEVQVEEKSLLDQIKSAITPKLKDISEDTRKEFEQKIADLEAKNSELEATISTLNTDIENYGVEKERIDNEANEAKDAEVIALLNVEEARNEVVELKTKLTKKVITHEDVKSDDDKLEIGELSAEEEAWLSEAEKMQKVM